MSTWEALTNMQEVCNIYEEMNKKYKNTVLGLVFPSGKTYFGTYIGINDYGRYVFKINQRLLYLVQNTSVHVFIPKLKRGFYTTETGEVFLIHKLPTRQYRHGINPDGIRLTSFLYKLRNIQPHISFIPTIVSILKKNSYSSLEEGFAIAEKNGCCAISRKFAITLNAETYDNVYYLWYEHCLVGFVSKEDKTINVINPDFYQEVIDSQQTLFKDYRIVLGVL